MDQAERLKIAFITPEMAPLAKTGGLADVTGALPKYLSRLGQLEVTVWLPCYREIKNKNLKLKTVASNLRLNFFQLIKPFQFLSIRRKALKFI